MTDRALFLERTSEALGRTITGRASFVPDQATHLALDRGIVEIATAKVLEEAQRRSKALFDELASSASTTGWNVHRTVSPDQAAGILLDICQSANVSTALYSNHPVFCRVPAIATLVSNGIAATLADTKVHRSRAELKAAEFSSDVGITGVEWAVAETGTIVLHARNRAPRLVSVAPERHIALVELGQVLPSLEDLFLIERLEHMSGRLSTSVNLVSGPSKTGDIGGKIVEGIHGPLEVHMILIG